MGKSSSTLWKSNKSLFLWVTPKSPISSGTCRILIPPQMTFSAGRKQGICTIYLREGQDHCSLEAEGLILVISFTYKFCCQTTANFTRGDLFYWAKLTYSHKKISTCSLPWKQQSTRWPSGAESQQDPLPLLHSLQHIHLRMRITAPHHQGKAQPSLALAVAPKKYAERKRNCLHMCVVWTNNLPLQLQ